MILTALGEESDKVHAFETGADDYLTKPFGVEELLARVRAVLRRAAWSEVVSAGGEGGRLAWRGLVLDPDRHRVSLNDRPLDLTPTEFSLLRVLMQEAGKVLTPRDLLRRVWGPEYGDEVEYVRVYVGRLRRKIETDPEAPS